MGFGKFILPSSKSFDLVDKLKERQFPPPALPPEGKKVEAVIAHFTSPDSFYMQLVSFSVCE